MDFAHSRLISDSDVMSRMSMLISGNPMLLHSIDFKKVNLCVYSISMPARIMLWLNIFFPIMARSSIYFLCWSSRGMCMGCSFITFSAPAKTSPDIVKSEVVGSLKCHGRCFPSEINISRALRIYSWALACRRSLLFSFLCAISSVSSASEIDVFFLGKR